MHHFRFALRSLLKTPGFTLVAVLTLALGIGTTTTVFSWIDRVLLNPLPGVADSRRMVALETLSPSGEMIDTSYPDYRDYQAQAKTVAGVLVFKERPLNLGEGEHSRRIWAQLVSGNFFTVLGVRPQLGRFFNAADRAEAPDAMPVTVISDTLWRAQFQADPHVLGRTVKLNQHAFTVIGVAPASFLGTLNGLSFDAWVPLMRHADLLGPSKWLESRGWRALHTLARLAPGATLASARAELAGLAAALGREYPKSNQQIGLATVNVADSPHGVQRELGRPLLLLLGVCGLLLVIVCANLSNLLLVRASARQREMSIRQALGARRGQLVRQLLAESLLLAAAGSAGAVLLTVWLADALRQFIPDATLPISLTAEIDGPVLGAALVLALGTAIVAGLASLLWTTRPDLVTALRAGGRSGALSAGAENFRSLLVIAQVAVACVTLACTGLAAKSFYAARRAHPGFDASGVLLAAIKLDASGYGTREQGVAFLDRLLPRLATLPGVDSAALAENVPLGLSRGSWEIVRVPGYLAGRQEDMRVYRNLVSPGYFSLMRIPLLAGRDFKADDRRGQPDVAIVSEAFVRWYFHGAPAVGRTFSIWGGARELTVVGVAGDIKVASLNESSVPYYYVPLAQFFSTDTGIGIHLRTRDDPLAHLGDLRVQVRALDPNVPVFEALTLEDYTSAARFAQKAAASLLGVLSVLALGLTSLGLYGVLSFAVAQRTPEIGVRLALGAQPADIARLVLARGGRLLLVGLGLGLLAAAGAGRVLAAVFYGLQPFEPALLLLIAPPLVLTALIACYLPARRATRVDPVVALRAE